VLYDFLSRKNEGLSYSGVDVSDGKIRATEQLYKDQPQAGFELQASPIKLPISAWPAAY
jgi:hypothetical protein